MASLYFAFGERAGERVSLDRDKTTFGRHARSDGVLKHKTVSREHFHVERIGKKFFLVDRGSNNGTSVNGERVSWVELKDGDEIKVGPFTLIAELPSVQGSRGAGGVGKDEGFGEKDENRSEAISSSFIPHPSSFQTPQHPSRLSSAPAFDKDFFLAEHVRAYPPEYLEGIRLFNAQRYFDAHEAWEEIWLRSSGDDKLFYQMLIQSAVGLHHYERGNSRGGRGMYKAVVEKLSRLPSIYKSLDLVEFSRQFKDFFANLIQYPDREGGDIHSSTEDAPPPDKERPSIRLLRGDPES